jgi:CRISPR/Cas system CSM-associated protein Csm3 (group 7 of RAMP superfamily)
MATVDLKITLQTPLHIGAGSITPDGTATMTVRFVRDARGRPCIPASTLKGLHRLTTERIAAALGLPVCGTPAASHMCHPTGGQAACVVCQIFGSPWSPGKIYHRDLAVNVTPLTRTRIVAPQSRRRRVQIERRHVNYEVLPGGTLFSGRLDCLFQDSALLALALAGLRSITMIGGGSAIGYGLCTVEALAFDVLNRPVDEAELADALRRLAKQP